MPQRRFEVTRRAERFMLSFYCSECVPLSMRVRYIKFRRTQMSMKLRATVVIAAAACVLPPSVFAEKIIIRPKEIRGVLVNPGMGITTFQRYNGDALNSGLKWSEAGPTAPLATPQQRPDFPATSVAYVRWFWATLEPEHGRIHWDIIDAALEQARVHGQTLAIRLMPYDPEHPLPEWYRNSGARRANKPTDKDGNIWQPDFSDPLFLKYWGEVVAAAGQRYDGHPLLDGVDISS